MTTAKKISEIKKLAKSGNIVGSITHKYNQIDGSKEPVYNEKKVMTIEEITMMTRVSKRNMVFVDSRDIIYIYNSIFTIELQKI